jgi:L-rhamnonate dehydratase
VRIKSIEAFAIPDLIAGGPHDGSGEDSCARRPPWTKDAEVATPMSRYPRYRMSRSSWRGSFSSVGVIATSEDGSWGFGTTEYGAPTISLINDHIGPLLGGENALATDRLYDIMMRIASGYSSAGLASYAISGIDLALWDLKGRLLKLPVYELSGGPAREGQLCYATGNDTDWHMELGFKATKLACPYGAADGLEALEKNEILIARARETVGPHVELMLDCWMSCDVEFAVRLAERLQPYHLRWIEDCLIPEDLPSHKALRNRLPWQTLATGEHWYTPYAFYAAARDRLADILQPDIAWVGGFTAVKRVTAIADAAGLEVICHAGMNTPYGQHSAVASPNSRWGEFYLGSAPGAPLENHRRYPGLAMPKNGFVTVSDEPGFGHGFSLSAIEKMAL